MRYIAGTPGRASSGQAWAYGMPATFGSSTAASYKYSICANYTVEDYAPQVTLIGNPYMYTARAYDIETGLYYYRARYYNPHIGRFLQVDPARQGMNWYAYCGNNPFNFTDPMGLYSWSIDIPLRVIWDSTSDPTYAGSDCPVYFKHVSNFFSCSNFGTMRLSDSIKLTGVTYRGTADNGNFTCTFESSRIPHCPFTIGTRNGVTVLLYRGDTVMDGRIADKLYGTSLCGVYYDENLMYSDWLAARHAAIEAERASLLNTITSWASGLWNAYNEGLEDGIAIAWYHDPCTIAQYGWVGEASNILGYGGQIAAAAAVGGGIGQFAGGAWAGCQTSFIFYSGGTYSLAALSAEMGTGVTINNLFGNILPYYFPGTTSTLYALTAGSSGANIQLIMNGASTSPYSYFLLYEFPVLNYFSAI